VRGCHSAQQVLPRVAGRVGRQLLEGAANANHRAAAGAALRAEVDQPVGSLPYVKPQSEQGLAGIQIYAASRQESIPNRHDQELAHSLEARMAKFNDLCRLAANSLVLQQQ
jgi:hypothetical protein